MSSTDRALIVGAGTGLSASLARKLSARGIPVALASRSPDKVPSIADDIGAKTFSVEAADPQSVAALFEAVDRDVGAPTIVIYNPSARSRASFQDLDAEQVRNAILVTAFGGFLVGQEAVKRMLPRQSGTILFTGASASIKGYPQSAPFAMGKFALRGLAQSMARELHPQGIHVGHVIIDGAIRNPGRTEPADKPDSMLDPDAIADSYLHMLDQPRSVWTWEIEVRPWVERF